jgi:plasmid stabilization system protein ParE
MTLPVVVRPEAKDDLEKARDWYKQQYAGLGSAFSNSVEEILARIIAMPEMYPLVLHKVRRGKVRRFPYVVYYRVLSDRIEIMAAFHSSRNPNIWRERADKITSA